MVELSQFSVFFYYLLILVVMFVSWYIGTIIFKSLLLTLNYYQNHTIIVEIILFDI